MATAVLKRGNTGNIRQYHPKPEDCCCSASRDFVTIAAGAWLKTGEDLPRPGLISHHKALNFRCSAQAYTLRLSFFTFLRKLYGLESVIELAYQEEPLSVEQFPKTFGASVAELSVVWRGWALQQFDKEPKALEQARTYRENTPVKYLPVCSKKELGLE